MTKSELIEQMTKATCSKKEASECLEQFIETITKELKAKRSVQITGFGTFSISHRKARIGRNPRTGAELKIPAMNVPRFKPGKGLKDATR